MSRFDLEDALNIQRARLSPLGWNTYTMRGRYLDPAHLRYLNERIVATVLKPNGRLKIEQPPRTGKSKLAGIGTSGWVIGMMPDSEVAYCSATLNLGRKHGRLTRGDMAQYGERVFGLRVNPERNAAADWGVVDAATGHASAGGFRAYGVGTQFTGEGANVLILDDLVKDSEAADSEAQKEALVDWLLETAWDRLEPGASVISIEHRWREDDPHGVIDEKLGHENWETVSLRMIAEDDDPLGRRPGEILWPERYDLERVSNLQKLPARTWNAKFQQRPSPEEGAIWRRTWWDANRYTVEQGRDGPIYVLGDYRCPDSALIKFTVVDIAFSEKKTADFTSILTFGLTPENPRRLLPISLRCERIPFPKLFPAIRSEMSATGSHVVYIEEEGQQLMVIQAARAAGLPVKTIGRNVNVDFRISGDKVNVAHEATPLASAGRVWMPAVAPWLATLEHSLLVFPNGAPPSADIEDTFAWGCLIGVRMGLRAAAPPQYPEDLSRPTSPIGPSSAGGLRGIMGPR